MRRTGCEDTGNNKEHQAQPIFGKKGIEQIK